jgi:hypothetical protein
VHFLLQGNNEREHRGNLNIKYIIGTNIDVDDDDDDDNAFRCGDACAGGKCMGKASVL